MKLSYCTTCKGRAEDLKETLLQNLADNARSNADFVVLDYSSDDGLAEWVQANCQTQILKGQLAFYRSAGQKYFHTAHAKNCAHLLATGDLLCNLDADNFTGEGWSDFIYDRINAGNDFLYSATGTGSHGRVVVKTDAFHAAGGYDERLSGYGWDDNDLTERLWKLGYRSQILPSEPLRCIPTKNHTSFFPSGLQDTEATSKANEKLSLESVAKGEYVANLGRKRGHIVVQKNFGKFLEIYA